MGKAISKGIFDETLDRAARRPAVIYHTGRGEPSSRFFRSAREAFEFVYNTLEIAGHETFSCEFRYMDGSGKERAKKMEIGFDFAEAGGSWGCAYSIDGEAPSSCAFKGRDDFADGFVYGAFLAFCLGRGNPFMTLKEAFLMTKTSPCMGCPDRTSECHADCGRYALYRKARAVLSKARQRG